MEDPTFALRKAGHIHIKFLHDDVDVVKSEFSLNGDCQGIRVVYEFNKAKRCVMLYNNEAGEKCVAGDPCLILPEQDWKLFYNYVWRNLRKWREDPMYIGEWSGLTLGIRYRVVTDGCGENPDACIYIFCCNDAVNVSEDGLPLSPTEHNKTYEMKFVFQWMDNRVLDDIFSEINKMFKWCKLCDRYNSVRVKLFEPVVGGDEKYSSPPPYHNH